MRCAEPFCAVPFPRVLVRSAGAAIEQAAAEKNDPFARRVVGHHVRVALWRANHIVLDPALAIPHPSVSQRTGRLIGGQAAKENRDAGACIVSHAMLITRGRAYVAELLPCLSVPCPSVAELFAASDDTSEEDYFFQDAVVDHRKVRAACRAGHIESHPVLAVPLPRVGFEPAFRLRTAEQDNFAARFIEGHGMVVAIADGAVGQFAPMLAVPFPRVAQALARLHIDAAVKHEAVAAGIVGGGREVASAGALASNSRPALALQRPRFDSTRLR